jgi:hypothetical protein
MKGVPKQVLKVALGSVTPFSVPANRGRRSAFPPYILALLSEAIFVRTPRYG